MSWRCEPKSTQLQCGPRTASHIIFSHPPSGVFVVQADGSRMWSLPPNSPVGTLKSPGNFSPALSPDGSRVAYAMVVTRDDTSAIVTSALDGSDLHRLTSNKAVDAYPAWSPDGTQILFYSDRAGSPGNPALSLFIMDSDGSNLRELSAESSRPISKYPPVWSPDGQRIAFVVGDLRREGLRPHNGNGRVWADGAWRDCKQSRVVSRRNSDRIHQRRKGDARAVYDGPRWG